MPSICTCGMWGVTLHVYLVGETGNGFHVIDKLSAKNNFSFCLHLMMTRQINGVLIIILVVSFLFLAFFPICSESVATPCPCDSTLYCSTRVGYDPLEWYALKCSQNCTGGKTMSVDLTVAGESVPSLLEVSVLNYDDFDLWKNNSYAPQTKYYNEIVDQTCASTQGSYVVSDTNNLYVTFKCSSTSNSPCNFTYDVGFRCYDPCSDLGCGLHSDCILDNLYQGNSYCNCTDGYTGTLCTVPPLPVGHEINCPDLIVSDYCQVATDCKSGSCNLLYKAKNVSLVYNINECEATFSSVFKRSSFISLRSNVDGVKKENSFSANDLNLIDIGSSLVLNIVSSLDGGISGDLSIQLFAASNVSDVQTLLNGPIDLDLKCSLTPMAWGVIAGGAGLFIIFVAGSVLFCRRRFFNVKETLDDRTVALAARSVLTEPGLIPEGGVPSNTRQSFVPDPSAQAVSYGQQAVPPLRIKNNGAFL